MSTPRPATAANPFGPAATLKTRGGDVGIYRLDSLGVDPSALPYSIKVLLESVLRNADGFEVTEDDVRRLSRWNGAVHRSASASSASGSTSTPHPEEASDARPDVGEVPFKPARVILQDFTGVPCVVDLASMRGAMKRAGGDPQRINPLVPVDLVIDHSVQVDEYANPLALSRNIGLEFERNRERYEFLKWGQRAFRNFSVVPPGTGIIHQVNLEHLATVVATRDGLAFPDSLVGTDSHTTMVNGLSVLGWGVGGIEAEACMLGQPLSLVTPQVVGMRLHGDLPEGATATDLVLTITQILRSHGVVDKFVEFFGPGLANMSVADRATIANMAPEYGATCGFFPIDEQTLAYLRLTGRDAERVDLVERYAKEQGLWREDRSDPQFSEKLELNLASITPSVAGPRRPQDRVELRSVKQSFRSTLVDVFKKSVGESATPRLDRWSAEAPVGAFHSDPLAAEIDLDGVEAATVEHLADDVKRETGIAVLGGRTLELHHGDVVIAAITSCTNTSNPGVMVAAGLLAKKANHRGLRVPPHVKTSLSPGSRVVTDYFDAAGLTEHLEALGFHTAGYGCMTCIGNSGPLPQSVSDAIDGHDLVCASVLSGNRNFEGRINPHVKANYLASPPLVVAYALAGTVDVNLMDEVIARDAKGEDVYLRELWPTQAEVDATIAACLSPDMFRKQYADVGTGNPRWNEIPVAESELFPFDPDSTYIQDPPYFVDMKASPNPIAPIVGARVLAILGDSVTTDHISPAGNIKKDSPAGTYLIECGVTPAEFNQYGARRGADAVMTRGTFANIRLKNLLAPGTEGGVTTYLPAGELMPIFDAAERYKASNTPLVVLAGSDYGMGSSRDWAAKGALLLGVKAVIASSFERIHRSNLVGMGVLPLVFRPGETYETLGLSGHETFDIDVTDDVTPKQEIRVIATSSEGKRTTFWAICRIDTPVEVHYYRNGGILQTVIRKLLARPA